VLADVDGTLTANKPGSGPVELTTPTAAVEIVRSAAVEAPDLHTDLVLQDRHDTSIIDTIAQAITAIPAAGISTLAGFFTSLTNALISIPNGGIVGGIVGFWANFVNSILGFGSGAITAYKPENSAIANVQGQLNAIQAQIAATGEGEVDGFNFAPLSTNWTSIYNSAIITSGGYVAADHPGTAGAYYTCQRWNKSQPSTTKYQLQMTIIGQNSGGVLTLGISGFGFANTTISGGRFPMILFDVSQFGAVIRFGSITGPVNSFNQAIAGWVEYFNVNMGSNMKTGDVLAIEVDEVNKLYRIYLNPGPGTEPLYTYVDSANAINRGTGNRWPFFECNILNDVFSVGNGWDNFYVFDRPTS
jgi:hypothetical protein